MMLREPWRTRLLFVSFAANLFLLGALGMRMFAHHDHMPPSEDAMVAHMTRSMGAADADRFRTVMLQARAENDAARLRMEAARREMTDAIGRTPYDEATVRAAMKAWQTAWIDWSDALGGSMLRALADLSPDGRRSLAEAGQHRPPRP